VAALKKQAGEIVADHGRPGHQKCTHESCSTSGVRLLMVPPNRFRAVNRRGTIEEVVIWVHSPLP
jgi:hypothetical protein